MFDSSGFRNDESMRARGEQTQQLTLPCTPCCFHCMDSLRSKGAAVFQVELQWEDGQWQQKLATLQNGV